MGQPSILADYVEPGEFAEHFGMPERQVRKLARDICACLIFGKRMIFLRHHVDMLLEAMTPCRSSSTSGEASGTTREQLPAGDYAALRARLKKPMRKGSRRKSSTERGNVVSMARAPD
jgi:hypothetical protein